MSGESSSMESADKRISPPKALVDSTPLAMDKNRESLKVKLLVRRSQSQLVEQNILPPLKTSPAIHEQRKLLERAKTGDLLKAKIQQRPNRQELERRHILESHEGHIDPSLADKYRMLEKAILVDQLNSKISHRPGPLELIEKNILHTNEPIEKIVKQGLVPFKVGGEEDDVKTTNFLSFEDDSQSSESDLFQQTTQVQPEIVFKKEPDTEIDTKSLESQTFEAIHAPTGVINISLVPSTSNISLATFKIHNPNEKTDVAAINIPPPPPPPKLELITYHVKPILQTQVKGLINTHTQNFLPIQISESPVNNVNTILSPPNLLPTQIQTTTVNQHVSSFLQNNQNQKYSAPGKEKNRKKCKNKVVSKRAIKFHEYKGPTNKNSGPSTTASTPNKKAGETNFELIMQQKCLLEYLEGIYKNPQATQSLKSDCESSMHMTKTMKIEAPSDSFNEDMDGKSSKSFTKPHVMIFPSKPPSSNINTSVNSNTNNITMVETIKDVSDVNKLSKMKVSELKAYLKRNNLPISGPKPLLIERLKPYLPLKPLDDNDDASVSSNVISEGNDVYNASVHSVSSTESEMDNMDAIVSSSSKDEDLNIVFEQQRKIEELQRKLQESQQQLEQMKQNKISTVPTANPAPVVFDSQYPMDQIPTVFVVGVTETPKITNEDAPQVEMCSTTKNDPQILLEAVSSTNVTNDVEKQHSTSNEDIIATSPIPMSQDISDVLEILLKNGEWPEISDVKIDNNFPQSSSEVTTISNDNLLSPKNFIDSFTNGNVLTDQFSANILSPMLQEEVINKNIDVVPTPVSTTILSNNFSSSFNNQNNIEFPMEIEEDIVNADFNRNFNQEFLETQPHQNIQPFDFNGLKMDNCDTKYNQYEKSVKPSHADVSLKNGDMKTEFPIHQKSPTKNGLIGNFDHDLFDTLKNNNINNNVSDMFLIPQEGKFSKDDNRSLINSFDIFGMESTPINMDFEDLQISSFESACRGNFNSPLYDDSMTCDL